MATDTLLYIAFQLIVPALFLVSFLAFLWGALLYIVSGSYDEELQDKGKTLMLYGVIAFFVMASVWALLRYTAMLALQ